MEVVNDDEMVNNLAHVERLAGNECRTCLQSCTEACQLFQNNDGIPEKLMDIAAVQVEEGDGLPACICLSCYRLLNLSYNFKRQIQDADVRLRGILKLQAHPVPHDKPHTNGATVKYIVTDIISNVTSCTKDDLVKQEIYVAHDIVTFHDTTVPSNARVNDEESRISQEFLRKTDEIELEQNEEDSPYDALKENVRNTELEVTFGQTHAKEMLAGALDDHSSHLSAPSTNDKCVKQEDMMLTQGNDASGNLAEDSRMEDLLKIGDKSDVSLEDLTDHDVSKALGTDGQDIKGGANCSDDEEKPLICRTARQRCLHCIKSFATKLALQRHMIVHKHKTKLRYVCHICDKQFSNIAKLKSHVRSSHEARKADVEVPQENNAQEKRANSKTSVKLTRNCSNALVDSTREEKRNFKFTCKVCSKQFIYQKSFISHAKSHPEYNEETTTSDDVLEQSANKANEQRDKAPVFRENESEEEEEEDDEDDNDNELPIESLQCTQCGKLFATKRNLKRHISTHSGLKFNCSTCGKGFSRVDKLKDHEQSKHKEEIFGNTDDEDDDEEDNENKVNENSESRKKDRHNRPHTCTLCPKAFAQAQSLANHMERHKRVKDTQKRFLCEVCSKCFAQSGSLVAHMRTHTGVKPYVCNVCSRAFTKSTYLQLHLRTHSGEKPYICQYCSRAFARANTLARHITMHTGEAKYHCQICTKSFRRLTSLNEHTYTHTGQRPYACKLCTKRYNNAGSLYAHTKKCKTQQLTGTTTTYAVSADSAPPQNDGPMSQLLIYSQRKLVEEATVGGQVVPTPQYMVANVHNQKTVSANVMQPFTVEDTSVYNAKQFKNPYYAIYPNM
ncbi:PREDICTED: zinc finger protein 271-like [Dinoponera quadriceps]|uniref:Zinc finger protein 271-like n=1 Tax=Dinoponera quadriceps TaxID=609295 RepID=A0A6P3YAN8_DINQU|nr:PREDICTED: zinc finger protein 271-like [Dinoponera quadriceps]